MPMDLVHNMRSPIATMMDSRLPIEKIPFRDPMSRFKR